MSQVFCLRVYLHFLLCDNGIPRYRVDVLTKPLSLDIGTKSIRQNNAGYSRVRPDVSRQVEISLDMVLFSISLQLFLNETQYA